MFRRVNLYAGPGNAKSTLAAYLYAQLKIKDCNVELVREFVKEFVYLKIRIESFDQLFIFANQIRQEDLVLRNGVDFIVTDCPVMLGIAYCKHYGLHGWQGLEIIEQDFEKKYPSLNILLKRSPDIPYKEFGRFQNKEEALKVDNLIHRLLKETKREYFEFFPNQFDDIMTCIDKHLQAK
jgi:nicotinamide riboside kinase